MASPLRSLFTDGSRYQKGYQLFLERSTELQCMQEFIDNQLPDIMDCTIHGKSHLNVIGVGSGSGELDLKILSALHLKNPDMTVDNEVVEPVPQQLKEYKDLVSQTPGLDYIKYNWHNMTAQEFEEQWKEKKMTKKADFIHMFQMLYYVRDRGATVSFYQSLLNKNGKLLISLLTGESGWAKLDKKYGSWFRDPEISNVAADEIVRYLDSKGLRCQRCVLPSQIDITECFTEGNEEGELLLDFLTEVLHFRKSAPPQLKSGVMKFLRLDCSEESNGKVMLNGDVEVIIIDQLT